MAAEITFQTRCLILLIARTTSYRQTEAQEIPDIQIEKHWRTFCAIQEEIGVRLSDFSLTMI